MTDSEMPLDFIRQIITDDLASGKHSEIVTRFPPHPNGFLHVGHAKAICINFGIGQEFAGRTFLRFDDTNPEKEREEYVQAIQEDIHWLGYDWAERLTHASDYFDQLYAAAEKLIADGNAYVDSLSADQIRDYRGTLTEPGRDSPFRNRPVQENLDLFRRMRAGEFADGEHVLRARIDMASPNMNLRDPLIYRIRHREHQVTGNKWCIYPLYDFAHGLSDAYEGITHSLCSLEFEDHRPLYDWFLDVLPTPNRPRQIEFARLNLAFTITSKSKLTRLVDEGIVDGWDDPRMPTIAGMRRRGYPPAAIVDFCNRVGITKKNTIIEMGVMENCIREQLGETAPRRMAVLDPLKIVLTSYPEHGTESMEAMNHPGNPGMGTRDLPFTREIFIDKDDFMEDPPRKYFRLKPGGEVRLRYAFIIRCDEVLKDDDGKVIELRCSHDPDSRHGMPGSDRKVKGTIHWVSADHCHTAPVRLYDRLFRVARPGAGGRDFIADVNPESLQTLSGAKLESSLAGAAPGERFQFERLGYFSRDSGAADSGTFNRIVTLRDSWKKIEQQQLGL